MTHQPSGATSPREDGSPERLAIDTIRTLTLDAVTKAKSGHIGSPLGLAPVAHTVWTKFLDYDPAKPDWPNRDRFVLSVGHASMLLYACLHLASVEEVDSHGEKSGKPAVGLDDIKAFRQLDSKTPGHPEYRMTTGVETTTGPLGQGCGNSVGMAIATQVLAKRFNKDDFHLFDHDIYVLCGDGDMMEGVVSEAASLAGHLQLPNLCWIYDSNQVSIEGSTDLAFNEDVGKRFEAYGWRVHHVDDANDTGKITEALSAFKATTDRPTLIVVRSVIGYGSPMAGTGKAHGEALAEPDLVAETKRSYGWPEDSSFLVPDGVKEAFTEAVASRGRPQREAWEALFRRYADKHPGDAEAFELLREGKLPEGWDKDLPVFPADEKGIATRDAGGKVLNAISPGLPGLMGGAADLAPSTKTDLKWEGAGSFEPGNYGGRNLHFGIREHAMGSAANGMALSYLRSYTGTFLVFLDYMRPPVRLAAIMETPVVFVFTHDSIGVGEDGPTHQPIEQLAMLRATPGLDTIRPGDANETAQAWKVALEETHAPTALVLSRQAVPTLDREKYASAEGVAKGGYVLGDCDGEPEVILIGTGSELPLVADAYEKLKADGVRARVVSLPSWYLFEKQDTAYRDSVLPPACKARLAVEQGSEIGWDRYVGSHGDTITMSSFGASAPLAKLKEKYGFTTEKVVAKAKELIEEAQS